MIIGGIWYIATDVPERSIEETAATTTPAAALKIPSAPTPTPVKSSTPVKPATTQPSPVKVSGYNSISSLLTQKEPLVCTIKAPSLNRSGTVYVAGGKMRINLKSLLNGVTVNVSMINDGSSLYVWKNGASTGLKLSAVLSVSGSAAASHGGIDPATEVSFSCNAWGVDASVFTPPSAVTFSTNQ